MTAAHPMPDPEPDRPHHPPAPPHRPEFVPDRGTSRRRVLIWAAVVVVLALLLGIGGWWLGVGRYSSVPAIAG
ncbi:hypothetical protein [Nocardia africana]|nr:hypothetical protein [Nocardia africana]SUA43084.1 Uncharacterised protein [Nocardia africana]